MVVIKLSPKINIWYILYLNYIYFTKNIDESFPFAIMQWYFVCFFLHLIFQ